MMDKQLQTPYFYIDQKDLQYDADLLQKALQDNWGNYIVGYSVKTNSLPWLLQYMKKQGFYAEIVSDDEYDLAKRVGFGERQLIYNGPIKNRSLVTSLLLNGGILNLDSSDELNWMEELSAEYPNRHFTIGLRVNCDIAALCPEEQLVEADGGRFGYCYENGVLGQVIERLRPLPNVRIAGLHLHSSTQSRSVGVYAALASMAVQIAEEYELKLSYVDMGGGYFGGRDDRPGYADYFPAICGQLRRKFDPSRTTLIAEPGVSLISRGISFVTSVMDSKDIRGRRFIVTDGSRTNLNPLVTRHQYPHHIVYRGKSDGEFLPRPDGRGVLPVQWVCGFTCMEYDRLFEITDGPELLPGDRIVYDTAGGYTMCLNPLFIRYFPPVYVRRTDGSLFTARSQWTNEEYMQRSCLEEESP